MTNFENRVRITAEGSYNLVVAWQNDHIDGDNPPFVLDNLIVRHTSCNAPQVQVISELQTEGRSSAIITSAVTGIDILYAVSPTTSIADAVFVDTIRNFDGQDTILLTSLSPSTSYYFLARSLCSADDYSQLARTSFITPCGLINEFPYHESFESISTTYMPGMISSICWTPFGASSGTSGNPRYQATTAATNVTDGARALQLVAHRTTALTLMLPEMEDISTLRLTFDVRYNDTKNMPILKAGYMTDPDDASTFVPVCTTAVSSSFTSYVVDFENAPAGSRMAFSYVGGNTNGKLIYLDNVSVLNVVDGNTYTDTVCYADDYVAHGFSISADSIPVGTSTYYLTVPGSTVSKPDTIHTLVLFKPNQAITTFYDTICGGMPYINGIWNISAPATRRYHQVFPNATAFGCDSTVELFLEVIPASNILRDTICKGGSYHFGDQTLTAPGTYIRTYQATPECTATDTLYLTVVPDSVFSSNAVCYANLPYVWNGQRCYTTGRYTAPIVGPKGCGQTAVLDLTVYVADSTVNASFCSGGSVYVVDTVISSPGNYILHRINSFGCDVNYHINVTENPAKIEDVYDVACEGIPYSRYGISSLMVTSDTVVSVTTRTSDYLCDSIAYIHISYHLTQYSDTSAVLGPNGTFTWHNQTYTVPGNYKDTLQGTDGCDSVVTLHLSVGEGVDNVAIFNVTLYPNPAESGQDVFISLDPSMAEQVTSVQILTTTGQVVYSQVVDSQIAGPQLTITNCQFPSGIYYVRLTTDNDRVSVQKLIIK